VAALQIINQPEAVYPVALLSRRFWLRHRNMTTHQVVSVPGEVSRPWGIVTSDGKGGQHLRQPLHQTEAETQAEADRLTASDQPEPH
jgi:hypothetical protein